MKSYLEQVDFENIKKRFDAFWRREVLDRPLISITAPRTKQKRRGFPVPKSVSERWTDVEYVLNKIELGLENTLFLGDAIPKARAELGPDSFTTFLGAKLKFNSERTSWAEPFIEDLSDYEPVIKEDGKWWGTINNLLDAICEAADGNFLVATPDIHYGGDSLVATVGATKLIRHLYTKPEEVKWLIKKLTSICREVFDHYYQKISKAQEGSTAFIPAYSRGKYFALQDDFSGLVSPEMFERFFAEEQETLSDYLDNSIFHLDGPMALGNLNRLLQIESLDGIQWVPGAGAKPMSEWIDVCAKILDAGKCLQIDCGMDEVESLLSSLEHKGLFISTHCDTEKQAYHVLKIAERSCRHK